MVPAVTGPPFYLLGTKRTKSLTIISSRIRSPFPDFAPEFQLGIRTLYLVCINSLVVLLHEGQQGVQSLLGDALIWAQQEKALPKSPGAEFFPSNDLPVDGGQ